MTQPQGTPNTCIIELTQKQASDLYLFLESPDCPNYWENPLCPVQSQVSDWYRSGAPLD